MIQTMVNTIRVNLFFINPFKHRITRRAHSFGIHHMHTITYNRHHENKIHTELETTVTVRLRDFDI